MTDRQESKLNMYLKVLEACRNYEKKYSHILIMVEVVRQLEENINAIRQTAQQQAGTITQGFTAEKQKTINLLTEQCVKLANILYVYGFRTNNQQLLSKMSINKRMLYNGHDNEILTLTKNVSAELATYIPMLGNYGIDPTELDAFNKTIATFETLISKPQITIGERKLHTGNLKHLFAEADSILYDQLDKLIVLFKTSDPDFYNLYKTARNIINTAKRSSRKETDTQTDTAELDIENQ
jgi:acetolactate synthase regulatory subunit